MIFTLTLPAFFSFGDNLPAVGRTSSRGVRGFSGQDQTVWE